MALKKEPKRQTAFRFKESIMSRLEQYSEHTEDSMNKIVSQLLDKNLPKLDLGGKIIIK